MVAAPLPDRVGHVGGIESLVVDGRRWYFGFDYSSDLVVSPLIDDPAEMARFASRFMEQTDGSHDAAYWAELVADAERESALAYDEDLLIDTAAMARDGVLSYHLRYLLDAASGRDETMFADPEIQEAMSFAGVPGSERNSDGLAHLEAALAEGGAVRDAARLVLRRHVTDLLDRAPGNWPEVLAGLRS